MARARRGKPIGLRLLVAFLASVCLGVVASAVAPAASGYQDWPTFLQNSSRTAATVDPKLNAASAATLELKWAYQTAGPVATSTAIVGTTAYLGSWDGYEYALNTATGALIWKQFLGITNDPACHPVKIGITSSAAVVHGVVYVGGGDSYWYALDAATGAVRWKLTTGDNSQAGGHYNWSSPLVANGFAYIGVASNCDNPKVQGHLMKVDLGSGQVVADYTFVPNGQLGGGIRTSPTYDDATNTVFVSTGTLNGYTQTQSQAIVALDAITLAYKSSWQAPFKAAVSDSDWGTTPTLTTDAGGDQLLAVANKNGTLYTFNRNDLSAGPRWQRQIAIGGACPTCGDGSIASGIFANGVLYYAGGSNVVNGHGAGGSITAFDPGAGKVLWTRQTDQPIIASPAYVGGLIGEVQGATFELVDASSGTLLYSYQLPSLVVGAVSVARRQFYVGADNGKLYAFGLGTPSTRPSDPNCPAGFTCQDIRHPGLAGHQQTANGVLSVTAAGAAIHGTADQFRFISKPVTGDSQMSVLIRSQSTQNAAAQNSAPQAGLMVRQSADPTAPFYGILAYPNDRTEGLPQPDLLIWYRSGFALNAIELTKWYPANKPVSVMVQRTGNQFSAGISFDGITYQLIPGTTVALDLPATTMQGIAVDSGSATNPGTASFANLSVANAITTTMTPQAPNDPCPATWTCRGVGNPNPPGNATVSGRSYTLDGTGTGIGGAADSLQYVSQSVSDSQTLSAQVKTQPGAPPAAQEGLMMRANARPTSPYYSFLVNPGGSAVISWRSYDGVINGATLPTPTVKSPAWMGIIRYQDTRFNPPVSFFSATTSADGTSWSPVLGSTVPIDMGSGAYLAGMAATAAAPGVTPPVVFNSVTISPTNAPPPGICPPGFTCDDIQTGLLPGNQVYLGGTWTLEASGADIWGVYDSFRFAHQSFPPGKSANGDGTISARVVAQDKVGGDWMKSGVMIRSGTDPQAPYYGVFVTAGHGLAVQWRSGRAAPTNQVLGASTTKAPVWLLASRFTDTAHHLVYYSAFSSTDGISFSFVPGSTVALNLPGPLVAGIAGDSYNSTALSVATVDDVAEGSGSQPPPYICPSKWTCSDIGGPLPVGLDQLNSSGRWSEVDGGGDIWDPADSFHFVSQPLNADGSATVHVTAQQATDPWAKAGPMLRATTDPLSPYYAAFVTPANGIAVQWRANQGGVSSQIVTVGAGSAYLRVTRYTTSDANPVTYYTAYTSPDGSTWTAVVGSTVALNLPGPLQAGFASTSHHQGIGSAVTLDSVAVTAGELPPPGLCQSGWQCADVGAATPAGGQQVANGSWFVQGGGGDIWGMADSFRYAWRSLPADGGASAQVTSSDAADPWAKAGVMMRVSTDAGSPYYGIFVTPGNGVSVQWRNALASPSNQILIPGTTPAFLQVTRAGTTFSAATSTDGVTWTPLANSSVSLPALSGAVLGGLAVTSHNPAALATVVFNAVSVASS